MPPFTPGPHTHEQWLGLVQPVGLVVAPAVLSALQLYPNQSTPYLSARQRQLEGLLEEVEGPGGQPLAVVPSFALLATDLLDWGEADLLDAEGLLAATELERLPEVVLAEYGETLRPTHAVPRCESAPAASKDDAGGKPAAASAASTLQALVVRPHPMAQRPWPA